MEAKTLAIVVLPDETKILKSDVAGMPAGDHLLKILGGLDGIAIRLLTDDKESSAREDIERFGSVRFPIRAADARDLAEHDVLVIDARAWLTHSLLTSLIDRARHGTEGLLLGDSRTDRAAQTAMALAAYFQQGQMRPGVLERARTKSRRGLEHVLSAEALSRMAVVRAIDLNVAGPAQLIDSYADLSEIERRALLDRENDAIEREVRIRGLRQDWLRGQLVCGADVELEINVIVEGTVALGNGVRIGANCVLRDSRIGDHTRINPFSLVEHASIGSDGIVGPYGRIRPASSIGDGVQIGNYVEIKNSEVGSRSRINHHSFIGDAMIAEDVTVGAGTITCNHDGVRINRTIVERGAYIGSGCNLVAPVRIGEGATVGAGSTITRDVPAAKLTLARSRQTTIANWRGPKQS